MKFDSELDPACVEIAIAPRLHGDCRGFARAVAMTLAHRYVINVLGRRIERTRHRFPRVGYDVKPVLHPIRQELIRSRCLGIEFPDRGYLIVDPEIRARRDGLEFLDRGYLIAASEIRARCDGIEFFNCGYLIADPEIRARRDGIEFFNRGYLIANPKIRAQCDGIEFTVAG